VRYCPWLALLGVLATAVVSAGEPPAKPAAPPECLMLNNQILGPRTQGQNLPLLSGDESHGFLPACSVLWSTLSPRNEPLPVVACFRGSLLQIANHDACGRETGPLWVSARWVVTTTDLAQQHTRVALCHQLETGAWAGTRDFHVDCRPTANAPTTSEQPAKAGAPGSAANAPAPPR
jgi:hypothetical protein